MPIRVGRITFILLAAVLAATLIAGCQPAKPAAQPNSPAATTYPGGGQSIAIPQVQGAYPGDNQQAAVQPAQPAQPPAPSGTQYPADQGQTGGAPAGAPAAPNQATLVAQLIEQRPGASADQVILHVKVVSANPAAGSTDFVTQLVNQEVDLAASSAGLPKLAKDDQFTAAVSLLGDEKSQQYSATNIVKK